MSIFCLLCLKQKGWEAFPLGEGSRVTAGKSLCVKSSQPWLSPALSAAESSGGSLLLQQLLHQEGHSETLEFSEHRPLQAPVQGFLQELQPLTLVLDPSPRMTAGNLNTRLSNGHGTA